MNIPYKKTENSDFSYDLGDYETKFINLNNNNSSHPKKYLWL